MLTKFQMDCEVKDPIDGKLYVPVYMLGIESL